MAVDVTDDAPFEESSRQDPLNAMLDAAAGADAAGDEDLAARIYGKVARLRDEELDKPSASRRDGVVRAGKKADAALDRIKKRHERELQEAALADRAAAFVADDDREKINTEAKRALAEGNKAGGDPNQLTWAVAIRRAHLSRVSDDPTRMAELGVALRHRKKFPEASAWFNLAAASIEKRNPIYVGDPAAAHECVSPAVTQAGPDVVRRFAWVYTAQAALWSDIGVNDPSRTRNTVDSIWWLAAEQQFERVGTVAGSSHVTAGLAALTINYIEKGYKPSHAKRARALILQLRGQDLYWSLRGRFNSFAEQRGYEPIP
jgi:hypothetical protein